MALSSSHRLPLSSPLLHGFRSHLFFIQITGGWWWGKSSPSAAWEPAAGTQTSPLGGSTSTSTTGSSSTTGSPPTGNAPPQAAAVGYNTLTFGPSIKVGSTPNPITSYPEFINGANWAPYTFTGTSWTDIGFTMNGDGSVSLDGTGPAFGNGLCTAVAGNAGLTNNRFNFTGVAFGGGFYAEAVMKGTSHELLGQ
jgi:hypothetical protein